MEWFELAVASVVALCVFWLPGIAVGLLARLRGLLLWATAPAIGVSAVVVGSIAAPFLGLRWGPEVVIGTTVLFAAATWAVMRIPALRAASHHSSPSRGAAFVAIALAGSATIIGARVAQLIGEPAAFSQTFDNIFHMNAIRFMLDTGNASSLHVGLLTSPPGGQPFYPAAWHALVALVAGIAGTSIPIAINGVTIVICAIVWPSGALLLTRTLLGRNRVVTVAAAVIAGALPQFPYFLMVYGVLYPYQLGVSLIPVALALLFLVLRDRSTLGSRIRLLLCLVLVLPGIAVAHPGALVAWLALGLPIVLVFLVEQLLKAKGARVRVGWIVALCGYLAFGAVAVYVLRPPIDARAWPQESSVSDALGDLMTLSAGGFMAPIVVAFLAAAGLFALCRGRSVRTLTIFGMYGTAAALFVVVAALPWGDLRDLITGSWYNNIPRLAALIPIIAVPLAAFGAASCLRALRARAGLGRATRRGMAWAGLVLVIIATQTGSISRAMVDGREEAFEMREKAPLIDADELALLNRLDEHVPEDEAIAGSPWTGTALAYALADRGVLLAHTLAYVGPDARVILEGPSEAEPGSAVCAALASEDVRWILDFGDREVHGGQHEFTGLTALVESSGVQLRDREGHARLYEIVACDR